MHTKIIKSLWYSSPWLWGRLAMVLAFLELGDGRLRWQKTAGCSLPGQEKQRRCGGLRWLLARGTKCVIYCMWYKNIYCMYIYIYIHTHTVIDTIGSDLIANPVLPRTLFPQLAQRQGVPHSQKARPRATKLCRMDSSKTLLLGSSKDECTARKDAGHSTHDSSLMAVLSRESLPVHTLVRTCPHRMNLVMVMFGTKFTIYYILYCIITLSLCIKHSLQCFTSREEYTLPPNIATNHLGDLFGASSLSHIGTSEFMVGSCRQVLHFFALLAMALLSEMEQAGFCSILKGNATQ